MNGPELNELPDDSGRLWPYVSSLRRRALQARELSAVRTFSDGFLLKFLRARDFDVELSLKVKLCSLQENKSLLRRESGAKLSYSATTSPSVWTQVN